MEDDSRSVDDPAQRRLNGGMDGIQHGACPARRVRRSLVWRRTRGLDRAADSVNDDGTRRVLEQRSDLAMLEERRDARQRPALIGHDAQRGGRIGGRRAESGRARLVESAAVGRATLNVRCASAELPTRFRIPLTVSTYVPGVIIVDGLIVRTIAFSGGGSLGFGAGGGVLPVVAGVGGGVGGRAAARPVSVAARFAESAAACLAAAALS